MSDASHTSVPFLKRAGVQNALLVIGVLAAMYAMANFELWRRARAAYLRGEKYFAEGQIRKALWEYQEVQEFYQPPRWSWVDKAERREWECRALLGDWVPPEGPLDADVRKMYPERHARHAEVVATITPVGDLNDKPAPPIPGEK